MICRVFMLILFMVSCSDSGSFSYKNASVSDKKERSKPDNDGIDIFTIGNGYTTNEDLDRENPDRKNFYLTVSGVFDESSVEIRSLNQYNSSVEITHMVEDTYLISNIGHKDFSAMILSDGALGALVNYDLERDTKNTRVTVKKLGSVRFDFTGADGWTEGLTLEVRVDGIENFARIVIEGQSAMIHGLPEGIREVVLTDENILLVRDVEVSGDITDHQILTDYREHKAAHQTPPNEWEQGGRFYPDQMGDGVKRGEISDKPYQDPDAPEESVPPSDTEPVSTDQGSHEHISDHNSDHNNGGGSNHRRR